MKAMKKVLAFVLALAMVVTAAPVTNAAAKTANLSAGKTVNKTYYTGKTHTLKLTGVTKADAKSTTWKSSNAKVVKIVADSQTKVSAQFKCVKKGTATVTAKVTLKNGNTKTYKAQIKVKAPTLTVSPSEMNLTVGQTQEITTVKKTPAGAKLTYESSDPGVASVEGKKITAKSAGRATITVQLTNGTKKLTKKIDVVVSAAKDGLSILPLSNPISSEYPNTVWVSENAIVNVQFVRDGKPAAGESLVMTKKSTTSFGTQAARLNNTVAVTNANGIATFVIGFNDDRRKTTDTDYVGCYDYTISTATGSAAVDGQVAFAAINIGTVRLQNKLAPWQGRPSDLNDLAIATNITNLVDGWRTPDGYTTTSSTATRRSSTLGIDADPIKGKDVDYVHSQQVSTSGTTNHQVAFDNFVPYIVLPKSGTDISRAEKFQQDVNYSTGAYSVYTDDVKVIKLNANAKELTYATLNFSKIQLSDHTKLVIGTYQSEWGANQANAGQRIGSEVQILNEKDMLINGYSIPLDENHSEVYVRLQLVSKGQVNTDKNGGYEIKDITGVYKKLSNGEYTSAPLKGAKVEWTTTTAPMSNEMTLTPAQAALIKNNTGVDFYGALGFTKVTYQVPVFPYTGNAILTCYDANNEVKAYYVYQTVNSSIADNSTNANVNVLALENKYAASGLVYGKAYCCYAVTKDEAFNQVGTIVSQENGRVVVNSDKVGVTSLKGTVTIDGMEVPGLDATNDTLYTSVQWCPIPNNVTPNTTEFALIGQKVTVTAQLVDQNNNPQKDAGRNITFNWGWKHGTGKFAVGVPCGVAQDRTAYNVVTPISVDATTDSNGQAKMELLCSEFAFVPGVYATEYTGRYKVILSFKNGDKPEKTDIVWIDPDLSFTAEVDDASTTPITGKPSWLLTPEERNDEAELSTIRTTVDTPFVSTSDAVPPFSIVLQPKTGTNWDYGFETVVSKTVYGDTEIKIDKVSGLGIGMAKDATGVGTVTFPTNKNGVASATSNKAGNMDITGTLDSNSDVSDVTAVINYASVKCVGEGTPSLNKKLTLNVEWQANGVAIAAVNANGTNAAVVSGAAFKTIYVKVTDKNGSPLGEDVVFVIDGNATKATLEKVEGSAPAQTITVTPTDGIAAVKVNLVDLDLKSSTITAYVRKDTIDQKAVAQSIRWTKNTTPFEIEKGKDRDDASYLTSIKNGKIVLTFSDNVVANSVVKDMFAVSIASRNGYTYEVTNATVSGNRIVLTVRNLPADLAADEPVTVEISRKTVGGIEYILTSDEGRELAGVGATVSVKVFDGTLEEPVVTVS